MSTKTKKYYYGAYDAKNDGNIIGIAYQTIGARGKRHKARWLEPVKRHVTASDLKQYHFRSYNVPVLAIAWGLDETLRTKGIHIES
jgi:hypothetical protein